MNRSHLTVTALSAINHPLWNGVVLFIQDLRKIKMHMHYKQIISSAGYKTSIAT